MTIQSLDHYNIRAGRELLEQLCSFYCEVVGLKNGPRPPFNEFGYWLYAGEQAVLHLSEAGGDEQLEIHVPGTFNHAAFVCSDRQGFEQRLSASGTKFSKARVPGTNIVQLFLEDPAGNGIELSFDEESV
jgi:catechol-2,3-dioxygenase